MICALEDLPLFGHRLDDGLERRSTICVSERAVADLRDDDFQASADRAEVFETLLPEEPGAIRRPCIVAPTREEGADRVPVDGCHAGKSITAMEAVSALEQARYG